MCSFTALKFSPDVQDYEKVKELILPENRTLDQKYHSANVQTLIEKHQRLAQQDPESAQFWIAETLASVNAAHEVCCYAWMLIFV